MHHNNERHAQGQCLVVIYSIFYSPVSGFHLQGWGQGPYSHLTFFQYKLPHESITSLWQNLFKWHTEAISLSGIREKWDVFHKINGL